MVNVLLLINFYFLKDGIMEKKICLMLCLAAVLLAASVASADTVKWKLKDGSASGDWGVGSNWSTGNVPTDLDLVLTGKYANEVEIHVTDAQSMGNKARFGDDALLTAPLLRIKSGGTLSQATSGMAKSYLGYVSDADVIVEAGTLLIDCI